MRGTRNPAHASGQYLIGGDLPVYRLGYGTMQLTPIFAGTDWTQAPLAETTLDQA